MSRGRGMSRGRTFIEQTAKEAVDVDIALASLTRGDVELQIRKAAGRFADVSQRGFSQRRRPRLVCRMTPVALITRRSECPSARLSCLRWRHSNLREQFATLAGQEVPEAISSRRTGERRACGGGDRVRSRAVARASLRPGIRRTSSTDGSSRKSSDFACTPFIPGLCHEMGPTFAADRGPAFTACADMRVDPECLASSASGCSPAFRCGRGG